MNRNKQTGRSNGGRVANSSLAIIALLVLCNLLVCRPASGRYLPTRADDTELEILKDLIRGLLTRSKLQNEQATLEGQWRNNNNYHNHRQQLAEAIQRRSVGEAELAQVGSSSGDADADERQIDGQQSFQRASPFYGNPAKLDG